MATSIRADTPGPARRTDFRLDRIPKGMMGMAHGVDRGRPVTNSLVKLFGCIRDHTDFLNRTEYLKK